MKITKTSLISGITRTKELDITQAQYDDWKAGVLIQRAMPNLSDSDREFLISGSTDEEWNNIMREEDDMFDEFGNKALI